MIRERVATGSGLCAAAWNAILKLGDKRYAVGLSTNDPNKFQSYHAAHVPILADEAQGIWGAIWEAVEGIRAGGDVRVPMQGNPTVTGGHYRFSVSMRFRNYAPVSVIMKLTPTSTWLTVLL